jgi:predicted MFS family arabinose efflux permease
MRRLGRAGIALATIIAGGRLDRRLTGILCVTGTNFAGFTALVTYFGLWLIQERGAELTQVSGALFAAGLAGALGGWQGGRLAERYGPHRMIVLVAAAQTAATAALALPVRLPAAIALLVVVTGTQPLRGIAQRLLVSRLSSARERDKAFAGFRLILNLGGLTGPLIGAGLVSWAWPALRVGVFLLYALSLTVALLVRPGRSAATRDNPTGDNPTGDNPTGDTATGDKRRAARPALADRRLWLVLAGSTSAWALMYLYESVLPIVVVGSGQLAAGRWGLFYALGPLLMLVGQLRVHAWARSWQASARLGIGLALMGAAFLLFLVPFSPVVLTALILVFVLGDILWGPDSEDIVVRTAPPGRTGPYIGLSTSTIWAGSAIAPVVGLPVYAHYGVGALGWLAVALAAAAAVCYLTAERTARDPGPDQGRPTGTLIAK